MGNLCTYLCKSSEEKARAKKPVDDDITPEELPIGSETSEQVPTENEIITVEEETTPIKVSISNEYEVEFNSPTSMAHVMGTFDVDERLPKFVTVPSSSSNQLKIEQAATIR